MKNAYIVDGIRTAVGKFGGSLSQVRPDDLGAIVIKELVKRNPSFDQTQIDDVIFGCANQAGEDNRDVARMSLLLAGLPVNVPGETINRLCSSGMASIANASRSIKSNEGDIYIAGGVESMTRAPYVLSKSGQAFGRDAQIFDTSIGWRFVNPLMHSQFGTDSMGETAENVALQFNISREDQDKFALNSQTKATKALNNKRFEREIVTVEIPQRKGEPIKFNTDEFIRQDTTLEALNSLRPAFKKDGTVTAGNASGINDGAAATLLVSDEALTKYQLTPKVKIISSAAVGVEPRIMGIGPVEAARKALKRANLTWNDIDIIELNEAFAAQALACTREWGFDDADPRINPNGGAIAIGHPLGMSGTRIVLTAMHELIEQDKEFALCTMCVGVGQGYATIIQRV